MYLLRKRLGGEAEGFVALDPQVLDASLAALLDVARVWHRRVGAEVHGDSYARGAFRCFCTHDLVAFHWAVIALGSPVGEEVLHRVARAGFPELISSGSVTRDERVEETLGGLFFRVVAESEPQRDNRDQRSRRDRESHGTR